MINTAKPFYLLKHVGATLLILITLFSLGLQQNQVFATGDHTNHTPIASCASACATSDNKQEMMLKEHAVRYTHKLKSTTPLNEGPQLALKKNYSRQMTQNKIISAYLIKPHLLATVFLD